MLVEPEALADIDGRKSAGASGSRQLGSVSLFLPPKEDSRDSNCYRQNPIHLQVRPRRGDIWSSCFSLQAVDLQLNIGLRSVHYFQKQEKHGHRVPDIEISSFLRCFCCLSDVPARLQGLQRVACYFFICACRFFRQRRHIQIFVLCCLRAV